MRAKKNAPTLNILQEKVGRSGEGSGSQKQLLTPSNRDEWQAHGLQFHVTFQKSRRGVNIMAIDTWPKASPPWLSNKPWSKGEDVKILFASKYFVYFWINKKYKGNKILNVLIILIYFFQRRWTWSWIKQSATNLAKFSNDTCVLKQVSMNFKYLCQSEIKSIKNLNRHIHGKFWAFYSFVAV